MASVQFTVHSISRLSQGAARRRIQVHYTAVGIYDTLLIRYSYTYRLLYRSPYSNQSMYSGLIRYSLHGGTFIHGGTFYRTVYTVAPLLM